MSFVLEVKGWVNFEFERSFDDILGARRFANERYSQNAWRIRDLVSDIVLHEHDPTQTIEDAALSESNRFVRFENWMQGESRRRLANIATRQRRSQVRPQRIKKKQSVVETVNWMVEGF